MGTGLGIIGNGLIIRLGLGIIGKGLRIMGSLGGDIILFGGVNILAVGGLFPTIFIMCILSGGLGTGRGTGGNSGLRNLRKAILGCGLPIIRDFILLIM